MVLTCDILLVIGLKKKKENVWFFNDSLDSLDGVHWIHIGLMQTSTRIFYRYRGIVFYFSFGIMFVIRILPLFTWETSAIGHHGRN